VGGAFFHPGLTWELSEHCGATVNASTPLSLFFSSLLLLDRVFVSNLTPNNTWKVYLPPPSLRPPTS